MSKLVDYEFNFLKMSLMALNVTLFFFFCVCVFFITNNTSKFMSVGK